MKLFLTTLLALSVTAITTQAQGQATSHIAPIDGVPQFEEGHELLDDTRTSANVDTSTSANININTTRSLRAEASPLTVGQAADLAISTFEIVNALKDVLPGMFKNKDCHQVACWVATTTENCGMAAANQVQRELMRGRNSFAVESEGPTGMWVRYWRTQFAPPNRGDVADGSCGGGSKFVVTNCQMAGKVYC